MPDFWSNHSSIVHFCWAWVRCTLSSCVCSHMTEVASSGVFCCCSQSALRYNVWVVTSVWVSPPSPTAQSRLAILLHSFCVTSEAKMFLFYFSWSCFTKITKLGFTSNAHIYHSYIILPCEMFKPCLMLPQAKLNSSHYPCQSEE